ncbi:hypothetical protein L2E82_27047 [Cichorium intybus]|uniref:Uncharacterized protein n=1 Tax=Cichorium intybus TaxID=13427 RepID=A0ACB9CSJ4_CICIN|nr:hypothetical protein L2E82_27047 [Cichorium intybus]
MSISFNRITPSKEETTTILDFEGDITKLADAESFLYRILRAVPSAFTRISIMLFKFNYNSEVSDLNNSLRTLETACKELKTRGLLVKLLEAVLKAGNTIGSKFQTRFRREVDSSSHHQPSWISLARSGNNTLKLN